MAEGTETKITNSLDASHPAMYGDWIVWADKHPHESKGAIFMRNVP
jgi:hypothetical protein